LRRGPCPGDVWSSGRIGFFRFAFYAWLRCNIRHLHRTGAVYDRICRSNAPPPAKLRFQPAHFSSHGASVKTAALLLPVAVRSSKSLPHLLPRQAFLYQASSRCRLRSSAAVPNLITQPTGLGCPWHRAGSSLESDIPHSNCSIDCRPRRRR
jgi:hypothetical protein